ncbi:terminase small subunit [Paraburkholderia sp. SARCC-3016]|uniref:terminase small subunit n=1 Tax=Paraburkholderia sp. SARCC-3016 TaxID=3058611 RepID=UPI002809A6DF|nr:terminase small subunit [Paraburkholderia sp. SARCC-3016]MDQ7981898.1 terminase small subunit [Paraburkholderia sp. SARCC-3016]
MSIHDSAPNNDEPSGQGDGKGTRYSPDLWEVIRRAWAGHPTMSYAAAVKIVGERLGIPVPSKGACATYAKRNGWVKDGAQRADADTAEPETPVVESPVPERAMAQLPPFDGSGRQSPADDASEVVQDAADGLNPRQRRFADFYLISLNATDAYKKAGYSGTGNSAEAAASQLLRNLKVQAYIAARQAVVQEKLEITQEMVLKRWWAIATADPNELVEYRRDNCRHCWGAAYGYQWIDEEEYMAAVVRHRRDEDKARDAGEKFHREPPDGSGGFGFMKSRAPNPDCPKCHGDGHGYVHIHDTRRASAVARLLYAGVKEGKEGIELKTHDQMKALDSVARHLGMFKEKVEIDVSVASTAELEATYDREMELARARALEFKGRGDRLKVVGGGE